MKKLILLMVISSLAFLTSCSDKNETFDGKWITKEMKIDVDIDCDCPDDKAAEIKKDLQARINEGFDEMKPSTYFVFKPDNTVDATIFGETLPATYKTDGDELHLKYEKENKEERAEIIREGDDVLFRTTAPKEELEKMTEVMNHPEYGEVKILFVDMSMTLAKSTSE